MSVRASTVAILLLAFASAARAQDDRSHFGISAAVVPRWNFLEPVADIMNVETDLRSLDFRVGLVRGRDLGGEWGISFVRKMIADGSIVQLSETACVSTNSGARCPRGVYHLTSDVSMRGAEVHSFIPFATMGRKAQIGMIVAGGVGWVEGTSDRFLEHLQVTANGTTITTDSLGTAPFKDTLKTVAKDLDVVPTARLEFAVAWIAAPGLKLSVSGGVNFPGYHVASVQANYLFGAR